MEMSLTCGFFLIPFEVEGRSVNSSGSGSGLPPEFVGGFRLLLPASFRPTELPDAGGAEFAA